SKFFRNQYGVVVDADSVASVVNIQHSDIVGNTFAGLQTANQDSSNNPAPVIVTNDWWGDPTGPYTPVPGPNCNNPGGLGDAITGSSAQAVNCAPFSHNPLAPPNAATSAAAATPDTTTDAP